MKYYLAVTPLFSQKKSFQLDQALKCLQNKKLLCFNMHDQIITKKNSYPVACFNNTVAFPVYLFMDPS